MNNVKTFVLMAGLMGLFLLVGQLLGGSQGLILALIFGSLFNFIMYFFSDRLVLRMYGAQVVTEAQAPELYAMVDRLRQRAGLPMPTVAVAPHAQPNAFATGRNPEHAAVSVTKGILAALDERELRGVLAHELSHVANRDILISSVASAIGMSITFIARFALFFGGGDNRNSNPLGAFGLLFAWILAPLAAAIIQMAVSRSREYQADESGAILSHDPDALASALMKLEATAKQVPVPASVTPSQAHLFIVNPLRGRQATSSFANLFSTHPPTAARVARLEEIKRQL
jgi:heat shock protein HtpX